jgi:hypothetical protein
MQGIVQKFADATWRAGNVAIPPVPILSVPTTLWAYFGGSLAQSQNMVAGAPPIISVGNPAFPPNGNFASVGPTTSTLHGNGYLDTGVLDDSQSFTLVVVARKNALSGVAVPLSNNDPAGSSFGILTNIQSTPPGFRCNVNGPAINLTLPASTDGDQTWFKIYIVTYDDPTYTMVIWNMTDGTSAALTGATASRLRSPSTFWAGYNQRFTTGVANPSDVAFVGKISGSINATQAQAIAANIRATLALTGMIV